MRETLLHLCESFIINRDIIKSKFGWESSYMYPVCAAVFTDKRQIADPQKLEHCKKILNTYTGIFSNFRSSAKLVMISMMAVSNDPEGKLSDALKVYDSLKNHFFTSSYLPVASMIIADMTDKLHFDEISARTRHIYDLMKREHPFLTSGEDSVFAAMLALSKMSDEDVVIETERCYDILRDSFFSSNAIQSLSHVLALCEGDAEMKCERTMELFRKLKESGRKYGTSYELATLGVLAMLPAEIDVIAKDVLDADEYLSAQRGYGIFGLTSKQRLMHAGMIAASDYIGGGSAAAMQSAAVSSAISLIAAQQAAICAVIAASTAASASSSN